MNKQRCQTNSVSTCICKNNSVSRLKLPLIVCGEESVVFHAGCTAYHLRRDNFSVPAGTPFRVRELKKNDKFGITIDGVTSASQSAMDTGAFVTIDSTTGKLVAKATATSGATFEGVVEGKRTMGGTLVTTAHTYGHSAVMYKVRVVTYDE